MTGTPDDQTSALVEGSRRGDPRLRVLVGVYAALYVAANIGSILAPRIVNRHPALLLAASARIRHLLFVVPAGLDPLRYSVIGFARLAVAAVVCYLLGRLYGARGFTWLDRQMGSKRPATLRWLETATDRVGWLMLLLMPGSNIVCALVGHRRMSARRFAVLTTIGLAFRLWWVWIAARHFEHQLKTALDWIGRYQWWLIGGFLALTVFQAWRRSSPAD